MNYHITIIREILNISFLVSVIYPVIYLLCSAISSIKKNIIVRYLTGIAISYVLFHIIISQFTSYLPLIRYLLPVLPIVLLVCSIGICEQKNKTYFGILILINAYVLLLSSQSVLMIERSAEYEELAHVLKNNNITSKAEFIMPVRPEVLKKYYDIQGEGISLYSLYFDGFLRYLSEDEINQTEKFDSTNFNYHFLTSSKISQSNVDIVAKKIIKSNEVVFVRTKFENSYNNDRIKKIVESGENNEPIQRLKLSKLNNDIFFILQKKMKLKKVIKSKNWNIYLFYSE